MRFRAKACPGLDPGWIPVGAKTTRQNENPEPRSDSIGTEKAPGSCRRNRGGCWRKSERPATSRIDRQRSRSRGVPDAARKLRDNLPKNPDFGDECQSEQDGSKVGKPGPINDGVGQPQIEEARGQERSRRVRFPGQL